MKKISRKVVSITVLLTLFTLGGCKQDTDQGSDDEIVRRLFDIRLDAWVDVVFTLYEGRTWGHVMEVREDRFFIYYTPFFTNPCWGSYAEPYNISTNPNDWKEILINSSTIIEIRTSDEVNYDHFNPLVTKGDIEDIYQRMFEEVTMVAIEGEGIEDGFLASKVIIQRGNASVSDNDIELALYMVENCP